MVNRLFERAVVADATAPIAPFALVASTSGPERLVDAYAREGVTLAVFTIVDDFPNSIEQTLKLIGKNRSYFLSHPDRFLLVDGVADVRRAKAERKLAVGFAFQGSNALLGELALVEVYRHLGVIQMLLAYNAGNLVADGCHEARDAGLSQFGRALILEMNRVGMIVDVSHVGRRSSLEAIEVTTKPPVFSHSSPKRFASHDRNITDDQIRACAAKDGVICLTGLGLFMDGERRKASVSKLADTIEYVAQLVGSRHAGLGLDYLMDTRGMADYLRANPSLYGGGGQYVLDDKLECVPPSLLPELTDELSRRGHSDTDVLGILGENYLRVIAANA